MQTGPCIGTQGSLEGNGERGTTTAPEARPASGVLDRPFTRCRTLGNYFVYFYLSVQRCVIPTLQGLSWGWMILNIGECLPGWPLVIALQRLHLPQKVRCHFPEMLSEAPRPFLDIFLIIQKRKTSNFLLWKLVRGAYFNQNMLRHGASLQSLIDLLFPEHR